MIWVATARVECPLGVIEDLRTLSEFKPPSPIIDWRIERVMEKEEPFSFPPQTENARTVEFLLRCRLDIPGEYSAVSDSTAWTTATQAIGRLIALLALRLWAPISPRTRDVGTEDGFGPKVEKRMIFYGRPREIRPSGLVSTPGVFVQEISSKVMRAALWLARGLAEADDIDRFLDLMNACSLLAPEFRGAASRPSRPCAHCGHVLTMEPGDKEYFLNLCSQVASDSKIAAAIWDLRCDLVHGGLEPLQEVDRVLALTPALLSVLRLAFSRLLGPGALEETGSAVPPWGFGLLDIRYLEGERDTA